VTPLFVGILTTASNAAVPENAAMIFRGMAGERIFQ
jgi:hypothetical protein